MLSRHPWQPRRHIPRAAGRPRVRWQSRDRPPRSGVAAWQLQQECAPVSGLAFETYGSAMCLDDAFHQREPDAYAPDAGALRFRAPGELVKNALLLGGRDAAPV